MNRNRVIVDLIFVLLILMVITLSCSFKIKRTVGQEACSFTSSHRVVLLGNEELDVDGIGLEELGMVDTFFREIYRDDGLDHVIAIVPSHGIETEPAITLLRYKWDWSTCQWSHESRIRVDLTQAILLNDDAAMFGWLVHELAHANGRNGHEGISDDAVWWERAALKAFYGRCGNLSGLQEQRCNSLRDFIGDHNG